MKSENKLGYGKNETKQRIANAMSQMTHVELSVAGYFLENHEIGDFSSKYISGILYTSDATLSRFAKKCGYKGYRELIFAYEQSLKIELQENNSEQRVDSFSEVVRSNYSSIINEGLPSMEADV